MCYSLNTRGEEFSLIKNIKAFAVAKLIVDKLKSNSKMKLIEVVYDINVRCVTEIPGCRAFEEI